MKKFIFIFILLLTITSCNKKDEILYINVSFNTDGGEEVSSKKFNPKKGIKMPFPQKEGFIFKYWMYNNEEFKGDLTKITTDIELIAKWEEDPYYLLNLNKYKVELIYPNKVTIIILNKNELLQIPEEPTKEGHTFVGWYLENKYYLFSSPIKKY